MGKKIKESVRDLAIAMGAEAAVFKLIDIYKCPEFMARYLVFSHLLLLLTFFKFSPYAIKFSSWLWKICKEKGQVIIGFIILIFYTRKFSITSPSTTQEKNMLAGIIVLTIILIIMQKNRNGRPYASNFINTRNLPNVAI